MSKKHDSVRECVEAAVRDEMALVNDSDTGFAILVAASFDGWLGEKILHALARLVVSGDEIDGLRAKLRKELFGPGRPLASFNNKITFAFALRFFGQDIRTGLRTVNKIRNRFAHSPDRLSFDCAEIRDLCQTLEVETVHEDLDLPDRYRSYLIEARTQIARRLLD